MLDSIVNEIAKWPTGNIADALKLMGYMCVITYQKKKQRYKSIRNSRALASELEALLDRPGEVAAGYDSDEHAIIDDW